MYPRILHLYGPLWINSYGLFIAIGFAVFIMLCTRDKRAQAFLPKVSVPDIVLVGMLAGIIGGRVLFVMQHGYLFADAWWEAFYPWVGGFNLLGAIIGVLGTLAVYLKRKKLPVLSFFDLLAIYAPLFQSIARIGCFLAGCCYGAPVSSSFFCAVKYTHPDSLAPLHVYLHPTQFYSVFASFVIFLLMYFVVQRWCKKPGQLVCVYLMLENSARFTVDFWRGNRELEHSIAGLTTMGGIISAYQQISIGLFILALAGCIYFSMSSWPKE